jgi:hypothetical protein
MTLRLLTRFLRRTAAGLLVASLLAAGAARAAEPAPFTAASLDQMLAPIALFPDALLSQVLMATTYPSDVALAVDWAYANRHLEGDAAVTAVQDKPWDPSVQSLVAFPQVLAMLGENPYWVRDLGDAFLAQPGEVMDSVQFLRGKAREAGNLKTTEQQVIAIEPAPPAPQVVVVHAPPPPAQIITIVPANPRVVFVPIYNPWWVFGPWWHPMFPPFFHPPPLRWGWRWSTVIHSGIWWGVGIGVTNALWGGVDWRRRDININVNRWNNINVNRRIDSRDQSVSWRHDVRNRHGTPYRDAATRDRLQQRVGDARSRVEYRGRDGQRDLARQELANRLGAENLDRGALRDIDRGQLPQRPAAANPGGNLRDRAGSVDRGQPQSRPGNLDPAQLPNRGGNVDRAQVRDRAASLDRSQMQNRTGNVDRSQVQNRTGNVDRSQVPSRPSGIDRSQPQNRIATADAATRDNALRGASNPALTRQQIERGTASRVAMQQRDSSGAGGVTGQRQ